MKNSFLQQVGVFIFAENGRRFELFSTFPTIVNMYNLQFIIHYLLNV